MAHEPDNTTPERRVPAEREALLRAYAAGQLSWRELQHQGFEDYVAVLGGLGELGLRPPMAPMEGPNLAARLRGRALLREALRRRAAGPVP